MKIAKGQPLPSFPYPPSEIAGCDEAGRGCLAGPVVAGVVILPKNYHLPLLNDSKALSPSQRSQLAVAIQEQALAWAIGLASPKEIDHYNILQAAFLAMHRGLNQLIEKANVRHLLIDGPFFKPYLQLPHTCVIAGDKRIPAISAASIIAKVYRDRLMSALAQDFPDYHWDKNKGYPTLSHRQAIALRGLSPHHRRSFAPCR